MTPVDMSPEAVRRRLEMVGRLYVPMTLEEAIATEEREPAPADMSPAAVSVRLRELSALWQLTLWLQNR